MGNVFYRCLGFQCKYLATCVGLPAENAEQMVQPRMRRSTENTIGYEMHLDGLMKQNKKKKEGEKKTIVTACDERFLSFRLNLHKLVPTTVTTKASPGAETAAVSYSVFNTERARGAAQVLNTGTPHQLCLIPSVFW